MLRRLAPSHYISTTVYISRHVYKRSVACLYSVLSGEDGKNTVLLLVRARRNSSRDLEAARAIHIHTAIRVKCLSTARIKHAWISDDKSCHCESATRRWQDWWPTGVIPCHTASRQQPPMPTGPLVLCTIARRSPHSLGDLKCTAHCPQRFVVAQTPDASHGPAHRTHTAWQAEPIGSARAA